MVPESKEKRERQFQLLGWVLFLVCSGFFIADSIAVGSPLGLAGGVIFLVACIVFLIPFTWGKW